MRLFSFTLLELRKTVHDKIFAAGLVVILIAGVFAVFQAKSLIDGQRRDMADALPHNRAESAKLLERNKSDLGNALYYIRFDAVHQPSSWSAIAIGQRDVNPYHLGIRILTLEGQLYDNGLDNPTTLLYGNFDLAFVFVFLIPLVLIAFNYNVLSDDEERGIWGLIASQPVNPARIVMIRIGLRTAIVAVVSILLLMFGVVATGAAPDRRLPLTIAILLSYVAFWGGLATFVASFRRSSGFNAIALLSVWIILTVLGPALLSLLISTAFPVSESFEVAVRQREGYHRKWDLAKRETMEPFWAEYPQYRDRTIPEDKFSWGWYYAMQHAGDREAAESSNGFAAKLRNRDSAIAAASWIMPSVGSQLALFDTAGTGLADHLSFLDSVRSFHRRVREHFYPAIFDGSNTNPGADDLPVNRFDGDSAPLTTRPSFLGGPILGLILLSLGLRRLSAAKPLE